ncbi:hypothetical protein PIB30_052202 [Stylosanthes scabra]|uniref:Uncharacterized protein n=1 Tax=Stylosanthes scabra TaxID=79078 RepID=A0ABU6WHZ6_9FABA|nr:hypothetical protein [Stylosanthes scabra]
MVTTPAKGNVVAAVADDIKGRGSELREKHKLMERTTVVMDAIVAGNSVSIAGVAKEREVEIEREDRRERDAMGRGRRFRRRCNSEWLPFLRRDSTVAVDEKRKKVSLCLLSLSRCLSLSHTRRKSLKSALHTLLPKENSGCELGMA